MAYRAVIFDMDGTLMNTLDDLCDSVNHMLRQHGWPERTLREVRAFVGNGAAKLIERAIPDGRNNPQFDQALADYKAWYDTHANVKTGPYPGVCDVLRALRARGIKTAIVSNKPVEPVKSLTELYFPGLFDAAIGEHPGVRCKPEPDMVRKAMQALGCAAEESVYVGDSEVDVATARNSGLPCVSVTWGFRDRDVLARAGADCYADTAEELLRQLLR